MLSNRLPIINNSISFPFSIPDANRKSSPIKMKQAPEEIKEYVKSFFVNLMETSKCYQLGVIDQETEH